MDGCALHLQVTKRRKNITFSANPRKFIPTKISESTVSIYYTMITYGYGLWFSFKQNCGF
jgi:hypothetical protein